MSSGREHLVKYLPLHLSASTAPRFPAAIARLQLSDEGELSPNLREASAVLLELQSPCARRTTQPRGSNHCIIVMAVMATQRETAARVEAVPSSPKCWRGIALGMTRLRPPLTQPPTGASDSGKGAEPSAAMPAAIASALLSSTKPSLQTNTE
eukprot:COSAG03_NODE_598_length_6798_cov_39.483654_11_plen_153_part_00